LPFENWINFDNGPTIAPRRSATPPGMTMTEARAHIAKSPQMQGTPSSGPDPGALEFLRRNALNACA
jgi:hypothetical protein